MAFEQLPLDWPRIMGAEHETTIPYPSVNTPTLTNTGLEYYLPYGLLSAHGFLENGARFYIDAGEHPEYATPETTQLRGPEGLLAHVAAGYRIVYGTVQRFNADLEVYSRTADPHGNTSGAHENYLVGPELRFQSPHILGPLALHLATRSIFTGSGMITPDGSFAISQKAHAIQHVISPSTTPRNNKPLVCDRDEPHATAAFPSQRLQVVGGDANILPVPIALKFGTTSLVLRMLEHGHYPFDGKQGAVALADPIATVHDVSQDLRFEQKYELSDSQKLTAAEIQRRLAQTAAAMCHRFRLPPDDVWTAHMWLNLANIAASALEPEQKQQALADQGVEWALKLHMLRRLQQKRGLGGAALGHPRLRRADIAWHHLKGSHAWFNRHYNTNDVSYAVEHAPTTTRAAARSRYIKNQADIEKLDWSYVKTRGRRVNLPPYANLSAA